MKRAAPAVAALLTLAACTDGPLVTAPAAPHVAFAASTARGGGANTVVPMSGFLLSPCTGETIHLTARLHVVSRTETDASGRVHTKTHSNLQDGSAVALGSGRQYRVITTENSAANGSDQAADESGTVLSFLVISTAGLDNWWARTVVHFTTNANGEPTATVERIDGGCRG